MPTLNVKKKSLFRSLNEQFTDEEFAELCFSFGLELDEVMEEDNETIYKIDIPANRCDLLCLEGLSVALLIFLEQRPQPVYKLVTNESTCLIVHNRLKKTKLIRPYIVAAILRNVTLDKESYDSFIDFQDKLHQNICRKRALVAIGTHDLDTITGPVIYDAKPPNDIKFRALNQDESHTAGELMAMYENHAQLKQYLSIIKDSPVYPVVLDSANVVLSLPPIINSNHSKINIYTKNIFIECTATDPNKAEIVLDTLVCAFSKYCENEFQIERCKVMSDDGFEWHPRLSTRTEFLSAKKVNRYIGVKITDSQIANLLNRMSLKTKILPNRGLEVKIPPTRHDIIHACDIIEDVAIALGYNNIPKSLPATFAVASQFGVNKLTEQLRCHIAYCGFLEALTFSLCSRDDISSKVRKEWCSNSIVQITNPKTIEFQVVRTTVLPGLLKTLSSNKQMPLPIKIFEVTDVVLKNIGKGVGAVNERHICALYYGKTSGFEILHGLLNKIMRILNVEKNFDEGYCIRPVDDPSYFPQRCAQILYKKEGIGFLGILHPEVILKFDLSLPCSCLEFSVEQFV